VACSSPTFTPVIDGTVQNTGGGTYLVTQNGSTRALGAPDGTNAGIGLDFWNGLTGPEKGYKLETADVLAIAGMDTGTHATFADISGTPSTTLPTGGTATYAGYYSATYFRQGGVNAAWNSYGTLVTTVDFDAATLTGVGTDTSGYSSNLAIAGNLTGTQFNGTAQFSAVDSGGTSTVPLTGGFYGSNTMAGIFQGATVAGVIYGN